MENSGGSPPRVRGKPLNSGYDAVKDRITPACAGKTPRFRIRIPRVRGSPPRVRGKHTDGVNSNDRLGITPACAGKT